MTDSKDKSELWRGGLPYAPDVLKLETAYPNPEEGQLITHGDFERLLLEQRGTQRYYGVINSWRKSLESMRGIVTAWLPGEGVKVLEPAERLTHAEMGLKSGLRRTGRGIRQFGHVERERLDDMGRKRYDHHRIIVAKTRDFVTSTRRALAIDLAPIKSLPKPKLVNKAG